MSIMTDVALPANPARRAFLGSGAALAIGGCVHCTFPAPDTGAPEKVGDAHAHFFNAADLPVAGFVKFVLIPRYLPNFPPYAAALVDIIAFIAKALTVSATAELRQIGSGAMSMRGTPGPADFAREAARAHRAGLKGIAPVPKVDELDPPGIAALARGQGRAASHRSLAALLGGTRASGKGGGGGLDERDFETIAIRGGTRGTVQIAEIDSLQCPTTDLQAAAMDEDGEARALLHWAFLMCRPRCVHVEEYLATIARPGAAVTDAINLLVDYDKWLNDTPRPGSAQDAQVAYWTRYADVAATVPGRLKLHTFAGYDPLRDAEERVLDRKSATTFAAMKQWAINGRDPASRASHRVAGFKLYPPMGFRPDVNADIRIPDARGGGAILKRWGSATTRIGGEIDASLNAFFDFCTEYDIPVMTHARESNIALDDHGGDPSPRHWLDRVEALATQYPLRKPLRLCLGHFDMEQCPTGPTDRDVLRDALRLNRAKKARMYFDLGFDDRILGGRGKALFQELAEVCTLAGDDGDYIVFGSDWIMLGNQGNADAYLKLAYAAALEVPFWRERTDKLFRRNLQNFLDPSVL